MPMLEKQSFPPEATTLAAAGGSAGGGLSSSKRGAVPRSGGSPHGGLGLEQYSELFRDNDIDGEILCGMTAEDLKELGINSFGHRRRLLNPITALGGEPRTRDVAQSATSVTSAPTSPP